VGRAQIQGRAADASTVLYDDLMEMISGCDVVFSAVLTARCLEAATQSAPFLHEGQIFVDINSAAPAVKSRAKEVVEARGARYVDAGVMAGVPIHGHRVPILLAGDAAQPLAELLAPAGMNLTIFSASVGDAAAAKMFQSILIKGTEALLLECLIAASQYGVERYILDSMTRFLTGLDWEARANYMLGRTAKHGARRADELDEVVRTLEGMGIEPMVTRGAAARLHWAAEHTHGRCRADEMPGYREVIAVLREAERA
jgi:3-hydroxyisobutyrate dehydrogenase